MLGWSFDPSFQASFRSFSFHLRCSFVLVFYFVRIDARFASLLSPSMDFSSSQG